MLEVCDLAATRGGRSLFAGLSFRLAAGEVHWVTGPNGCGKTTLLRAVAGLTPPHAGQVRWRGAPDEPARAALHFVGHRNGANEALSAAENLADAARIAGRTVTPSEVAAALAAAGLAARARLPLRRLSQGQQRRAALARLTLWPARLWVLDEPLTALDDDGARWLCATLERHLAAGGAALLTSHQPLPLATVPVELRLGR